MQQPVASPSPSPLTEAATLVDGLVASLEFIAEELDGAEDHAGFASLDESLRCAWFWLGKAQRAPHDAYRESDSLIAAAHLHFAREALRSLGDLDSTRGLAGDIARAVSLLRRAAQQIQRERSAA